MADTKNTATTAPAVVAPVEAAPEATRQTIARTVAILKYSLNEVYKDAQRQNPLFSATTEIAKARYAASVKSLTEFAESMTRI